jgi:glycosyltransferase involved in cell wall biosynthesis
LLKLVAVVDLTRPCEPLWVDPQYGSVFVLVTFEDAPICTFELSCNSDTRQVTSERLRTEALRHSGERVWQRGVSTRFEEPQCALPPISIVVCTRDRVRLLERCLQSLCALDYPEFEVVVVDNCSRDAEVKAVVELAGFRYVRENRPGLDWARNRGIREARYDIVSYIDDDALASRGWLHGIARGFQDPSVTAVTGLVLPAELDTEAQTIFELYGGMSKGFLPKIFRTGDLPELGCYAAHNFGVGANMSFRRHIFEQAGTFDTMLDVGTPSSGGGDVDMFHRIVAGGSSIRYQPEAMIWHRHRRSYDGLRRQIYANGRGYGVYLIKTWRASQSRGVMRYAARWMSGWVLRRVIQSLLGREKFPRDLIWAEFRGALDAPRAYFATVKNDRRVRRIYGEFDGTTGADVRGQR